MTRILIVKIGAIGDVIMTLPILTEIKRQHPDSHITWVCGEIVKPILSSIPSINEVISINESKLFSGSKLKAIKELAVIQNKLAFKKYDFLINYHPDRRYKLISALVRSTNKLFLTRNDDRPALIPGRSRPFEHVRLFLQSDNSFNGYIQFPEDRIDKLKLPDVIANELKADQRRVIIAPGGAKNALYEQELRRWPVENYVKLTEILLKNNYQVILSGGPSDTWVVEHFKHLDIVNLVGKLLLVEVIALMRNAEFVVTHDSGPYHLAVFANSPHVIALFGPTNPHEFSYGKNFNKVKMVWSGSGLLCSPCYYGKYFSTQCQSNICMQLIDPTSVIEIISNIAVN
ncbi:glycosyltransferase family 9 protein [Mucilaginibacter sp. HC2]|uniref:glycosyltransferase family 9 protein n=1 Tax=Mucilaginibacter inviolabilis TaxID=2714892 RepID=UPI00140A806D|nr:glycosyltransferase family 9 protein [Mucilaginibacter inviolabilis]NHA04452.1 glycosyltransferase family 9 protein [Mucilaginibacter inviolabilis]